MPIYFLVKVRTQWGEAYFWFDGSLNPFFFIFDLETIIITFLSPCRELEARVTQYGGE